MIIMLILFVIILAIITFLAFIGKFWIATALVIIFGVVAGVVFFALKWLFRPRIQPSF